MKIPTSFSILAAALLLPHTSHSALVNVGDKAFFFFTNNSADFTSEGNLWDAVSFSNTQRDAAKDPGGTPQVLNANLLDTTGVATGIGITMVNPMNGSSNQGGAGTGNNTGAWPAAAANLYLYGNDGDFGSSVDDGVATFTLTGFNPALSYNLDFFGAREGAGLRETMFTLTGATTPAAITYNVRANTSTSALFTGVSPDAMGNFSLRLESGPQNDPTTNFFYINAGKITVVPEPSAALLGLAGALPLLRRRRR